MTPEVFAEWLREEGHRVVRSESSFWFNQGPRAFQAFPYHWLVTPSEDEIRELMRKNRMVALRYSAPEGSFRAVKSYHIVCRNRSYGLESLTRQSRQNVQSGLSKCAVQEITLDRLAAEGWSLHRDTVERQGRNDDTSESVWKSRMISAGHYDGFRAWGAFVDGKLAASLFGFQCQDTMILLEHQSLGEFVPMRANHALSYTVTTLLMSNPAIKEIFYTLQSLDAPPSVDEFKLRMGYESISVGQRVAFHPLVSPFLGKRAHRMMLALREKHPKNNGLSKMEGMARFYLGGVGGSITQQSDSSDHSRPAGVPKAVLSGETADGRPKFLPGDMVRVRPFAEILPTLDANGCVDALPFMLEMKKHCGTTQRVVQRADKTCVLGSPIRKLKGTVALDGLRCDGSDHGGCQLACSIFWKEEWLAQVSDKELPLRPGSVDKESPASLRTRAGENTYVCQATELHRATTDLPWWQFSQYLVDVRSKTFSPLEMVKVLFQLVFGRMEYLLVRVQQARHDGSSSHEEDALHLQPGELVEVKSLGEIAATLDRKGSLRGLSFQIDMIHDCGKRFRVRSRVERLIHESTGKMRDVKNTVYLEGGICDRHRGCGRRMYHVWREAWLRRVEGQGSEGPSLMP
jgi:hypothetical protein